MIKEVINEEELLDLALFRLSIEDNDNALDIVVAYVMENMLEPIIGEPTEEQNEYISNEVNKLIVEYCLASLVKKGLVDTEFDEDDIRYSISDLGKEVSDACKDSE